MRSFEEIGLIPSLARVVKERGFTQPSDIQSGTIPILLEKATDFIGLAQTGTGKTAAFGLPLLQKLDLKGKYTQGIILSPTRELAIQTFKELSLFGKYLNGLKMENVYGGTPVHKQAKRIQRNAPHIIVGTPGRVIDLLKRKSIILDKVRFFILDEADEMLNMGFEQEIKKILEFASDGANTWLFSATMPKSIRGIVKKYMNDPVEVAVNTENKVNQNIKHMYSFVNRENKFDKLTYIIDKAQDLYGVIFCRMKSETEQLAKDLNRHGYNAEAINGDLSQGKREQVIKRFRSKNTNILVASDVAARGLDIKNLTHVIHYALPDTFEYYTHRSGRTGRAGEDGISIAFIGKKDVGKLKRMEKALKINFEEYKIDLKPPTAQEKVEEWIQRNGDHKEGGNPLIIDALKARLDEWSKEELIHVIANTQLAPTEKEKRFAKLERSSDRSSHKEQRNDSGKKRKKEKVKPKKAKKKHNPNFTDIFINIGYSDGFGDVALEDFISKNTGISKSKIGAFEINKRYSLFGLDKGLANQLDFLFKDVDLKGRRIIAKVDEG
ncbi:DEAD/DEAH box helicase [Portibacter marinus]|uniref:DEAD/DEAH box helicase n=1 Tax=Portibacter marinus TaxID=2898660 RepID=UPI001F3BF337|nr:DEAD/DEAH box helicase [Portibacter marinus]